PSPRRSRSRARTCTRTISTTTYPQVFKLGGQMVKWLHDLWNGPKGVEPSVRWTPLSNWKNWCPMPMKLLRQSLTVSLVFALCGCKPSDERGIEGIVFTKPITESHILHGMFPDEDSTPVAGAEAYLAFDEKGRRPIEGYAATSDSSGSYQI